MLAVFAGASGDHVPLHIDIDFARRAGMPDVFAHGMLGMAWLGVARPGVAGRSRRVSRARYTVAIPPWPISSRISYFSTLSGRMASHGEVRRYRHARIGAATKAKKNRRDQVTAESGVKPIKGREACLTSYSCNRCIPPAPLGVETGDQHT
jgi:hypothetical protein